VTTHGAVTGVPQAARENWLAQLLGGHWLRFENELFLLLLLAFLCAVALDRTRFGNHLLALGREPAQRGISGRPGEPGKNACFLPLLVLCGIFGDRNSH
jgi:ribose/xylose/arabinose/galactoside ABC-type transport system permease subunit